MLRINVLDIVLPVVFTNKPGGQRRATVPSSLGEEDLQRPHIRKTPSSLSSLSNENLFSTRIPRTICSGNQYRPGVRAPPPSAMERPISYNFKRKNVGFSNSILFWSTTYILCRVAVWRAAAVTGKGATTNKGDIRKQWSIDVPTIFLGASLKLFVNGNISRPSLSLERRFFLL